MRSLRSRLRDARRRAVVLALVVGFGCAIAPADAAAPANGGGSAYLDPSRDLGAGSPSCRFALAPTERASCRASGSAVHRYPLSSYGIDVRVGYSVTDPGKSFLAALQSLAAGIWIGIVFLLKGVLLLVEWTFALDLTGRAMPEAQRTMARLHDRAFGDPWLITAISIAGVWGIWRGLVQRQATQTLAGLAATVGLMVAALLIISQPAATVGHASRLANEAGARVLAAATTGDVREPRAALASSLGGVFDTTVRDPWCALEFGSVDYCDERVGGGRRTNGELWLAYPAQSRQRAGLHRLLKGEDPDGEGGLGLPGVVPGAGVIDSAAGALGVGEEDSRLPDDVRDAVAKDPERARMQEAGGTFPRFALLGVIALGLLGASALLGYLGLRLLLASVLTVLLLLFAPAMLLAPAFGDSGRALFVAWVKRLLAAIAAELIYALFLAVVLAASQTFTQLGIGWFGTWLLMIAFWWGVFLKRHELVGFVSYGLPRTEGRGMGGVLSHAYYGWQLARGARGTLRAGLNPARRAAGELRERRTDASVARAAVTAGAAREQLDANAASVLTDRHASARATVGRRETLQRELRATDRRLQGYDDASAAARAQGVDRPAPTQEQQALIAYRQRLRATLDDPALRGAEDIVRHAERNRAQTGAEISERDLSAYRAARLRDRQLPADHESNLRAAGIDPAAYAAASPQRREQLVAQTQAFLERERDLLDVAADGDAPDPARVQRAARWLPSDELRARESAERARVRQERRRRRARAGVYRPR